MENDKHLSNRVGYIHSYEHPHCPEKNCYYPEKNCYYPEKNCYYPEKHCYYPEKHCYYPEKHCMPNYCEKKGVDYVINLKDKIEKRQDIYTYKLKKIQFLESTGIQECCEKNKLVIKKAVISGPTKMVDVTHQILLANGQIGDCPIPCLKVDTGKLNEYPGCDVEPGFRKIIQIDYYTDEHVDQQKKISVKNNEGCIYYSDPLCCEPKCAPHCESKCAPHCEPKCEPHCEPKCEPHCPPKKKCRKKKKTVCPPKCPPKCPPECPPDYHHCNVKMSQTLLFPLYPIRGPFCQVVYHKYHC